MARSKPKKKKRSAPRKQTPKPQQAEALPRDDGGQASEGLQSTPEVEPSITSILLTVAQVCSLLNLSRSTLDRMAKAGQIPGRVKIGGQVRYHRQVLETWLLDQVQSLPSNPTP